MTEGRFPKDRLKMSKFKLDALLDITLSINANLPTSELLRKYESILRKDLGIGKILLYNMVSTGKHSLTQASRKPSVIP